MAGLDSINAGQKSGDGYHPGLDGKPFNPKINKPSVDAPTFESGQGGGQGDGQASGLPGTPYKAKKPNPQDGGGHKPGYGDRWKQAFDERFGKDESGQAGSKQPGGQGKDLKQLRQTARSGTTQEKVEAIKDVGKSVVTALEHAKGNPRAAVGELADQYLHVGQKLGDAMWLAWMVVFVAGTIASFVILGGGIPGLIVLNIMLVSPQTAYRLTEFILDFFAVGEVLQTADAIGLTNVKVTIRGWQKAIIVLLDIVTLLFTLFMTVIIITSFCYFIKTPDLFFSYAKLAPTDAIGAAVDKYFGYPIFETCGKFTDFAGGVVSNVTGNNGATPPGGPINTGQWKDLVNKYAAKYQLDPCALNTLLIKESSGGDPNAIGHDTHQKSQDPFIANTPPRYGLNFEPSTWSHGIGLIQPTIFPFAHRYGHWSNPNIPARVEWGHDYTIQELLDPEINMDFGAHLLSDRLKSSGGDYQAAFGAYNGSGRDGNYAITAMKLYNECKAGQ